MLLLAVSTTLAAQEAKKKPAARKAAAKPAAHAKATPEQIRRFNELQKQQKK